MNRERLETLAQVQIAKSRDRTALIRFLLDAGAGALEAESIADAALVQDRRRTSVSAALKGVFVGIPLGVGGTAVFLTLVALAIGGWIWPWGIAVSGIVAIVGWIAILSGIRQFGSPRLLWAGLSERIRELIT